MNNTLLDENSYGHILKYDVLHKPLIGAKTFCIIYNKVDGFIRNSDRTKCLVLFGSKEHDVIFDWIGYLIG